MDVLFFNIKCIDNVSNYDSYYEDGKKNGKVIVSFGDFRLPKYGTKGHLFFKHISISPRRFL